METKLMRNTIYTCAKTCLKAIEYTLDQAIKSKLLKALGIRLYTNPAVIIENISFLSLAVNDID